MNNSGNFFSLALYESMRNSNDNSRKKKSEQGNRKTKGTKPANVRGKKDRCSTKKSQENKAIREVSEEKPVEALVFSDEIKEK